MEPDPRSVDPALVVDDGKRVGELVDRDRGQAQADHGGDLVRVDPQLESLAGADHRGQRHQAGHGEDDLGGDGGRAEEVPGAAVMDGPHQPVGAAPVHVHRRQACRDPAAGFGGGRIAGQEALVAELPEEGSGGRASSVDVLTGAQLTADVCFGG